MAAGVSSPSRQAYLHHSLSNNTTTTTATADYDLALKSSCSTASSSSPAFSHEPESSPSLSAATTSCRSLPASDSRHSLNPGSSISPFSTPALSPVPPHSPLETVTESDPSSSPSSPASLASTSPSRYLSQQPQQPQQQQLETKDLRGDLKTQRSGGFFAFAVSAIDRTQSAIATISDPNVRQKRSLSRLSISGDVPATSRAAEPSPDKSTRYRPASITSSPSSANFFSTVSYPKSPSSQASLAQESIYSQRYSETDATQPPPILLPRIDNKMHQTSSRLLRMTDDDRPFTKVSYHLAQYVSLQRAVSRPHPRPTNCPDTGQYFARGSGANKS